VSGEQGWLPASEGWRQAATFAGSDDVQNFFELEEVLSESFVPTAPAHACVQ
jgi:hypothetical protein